MTAMSPEYMRQWREDNPEKIDAINARKRAKLRSHPEQGREQHRRWKEANRAKVRAAKKRHREAHPERERARRAVNNAIRDGRLVRLPCVACGEVRSEGHHHDYDQPLNVTWLCNEHHNILHAALGG